MLGQGPLMPVEPRGRFAGVQPSKGAWFRFRDHCITSGLARVGFSQDQQRSVLLSANLAVRVPWYHRHTRAEGT